MTRGYAVRMTAAVSIIFAALGSAGAQDASAERLDDRPMFASGQDAFEKTCARCHYDGENTVGPDLFRSDAEYDPDIIIFFARNGSGPMPAFTESMIDNATLEDLAAFVVDNGKGAPQ